MPAATEIIGRLQARGVMFQRDPSGGLRVIGASRLSEQEKTALKAHKTAILRALAAPSAPDPNRTQPPAAGETQPFGQRELDAIRQGFGVWVWSGVLEEWLFWVRDDERKAKAMAKGIDRWRIWTLDELTAAQGMPPADLRNVVAIKRRFDEAIQPGGKPQRWRDALSPLQPAVGAPPASAADAPATLVPPRRNPAHSAQEPHS